MKTAMNNGLSLEAMIAPKGAKSTRPAGGRPVGTATPYSVTYYDVTAARERTRRFACKDRARAFQLGLRTTATSVGPVVTRKAK